MITAVYDRGNKCVYFKEGTEYIGTIYNVHSTEVKEVGTREKVTFKNANGIPILLLFCEYSESKW